MRTDRQTYRQDEARSRFSQFCEKPLKTGIYVILFISNVTK